MRQHRIQQLGLLGENERDEQTQVTGRRTCSDAGNRHVVAQHTTHGTLSMSNQVCIRTRVQARICNFTLGPIYVTLYIYHISRTQPIHAYIWYWLSLRRITEDILSVCLSSSFNVLYMYWVEYDPCCKHWNA
ncbi:hypothetical protein SCLCIDRAFT_1217041 [Scleroderma citrinum Foug A]|uniref:Uncharacterized protein n=1 Tax=Scleroderma citrinum Foug A TaxID=1036808 RepID=A0A0C3DVN5_9AGAM|nr:hypothetical protein SCLCIDRAFT_1217041 [Scleroderma citrinum Foug A]